MNKVIYLLLALILFSCGESKPSSTETTNLSELASYKEKDAQEEKSKQFIQDYLRDINTNDWKTLIPKYLPPNSDSFLEQHAAFRASFPNYRITIKHLSADGNEVIAWMNITATYAATYDFEDTDFKEAIKGIEAKNQLLSWDEVWYLDVVDGKFGDTWDYLKDQYVILRDLEVL